MLAYLFQNEITLTAAHTFLAFPLFSVLLITYGGERHLSANDLMHHPLSIANFPCDWKGKWKHQ